MDNLINRLAKLDELMRLGAVVVVKMDGVRAIEMNPNVYTVVLSGGELAEEDFFRSDGADLGELLDSAIRFYESRRRPVNSAV